MCSRIHCACPTFWHSQQRDGSLHGKEHHAQTTHAIRASARSRATALSKGAEAGTKAKSDEEVELRAIEEDLAATVRSSTAGLADDEEEDVSLLPPLLGLVPVLQECVVVFAAKIEWFKVFGTVRLEKV